ncbi:signal peptidase I [Gordonia metallireducens]|uniref:signal peptidase I n=1 Tax=Gordonia metallireducens TaxID=2897779 RepID=UPI001E63082E|nr:signal peptidase I [Gordonia metallireducens]
MNEYTHVPGTTVDEQRTIEFVKAAPPLTDSAYTKSPDRDSADGTDTKHGALHFLRQGISWLLLIGAVAILCATILIPKIAGAQPYTVLTGSMKPDYPPGTLIVVKPRPADEIGVGDVVTYQIRSGSPEVITHRVIEVTENPQGELRFVTQGDNNGLADAEPVRPVQVRGTLWYSVPYIGWVNNWFTGQRRTVLIFAAAGALFVYGGWQFIADRRQKSDVSDSDAAPTDPETSA